MKKEKFEQAFKKSYSIDYYTVVYVAHTKIYVSDYILRGDYVLLIRDNRIIAETRLKDIKQVD